MPGDFPLWLNLLALASLSLAVVCAITVALDEYRRPQRMWIMNIVWPLTTLFGSFLWLAGYYAWGRTREPSGGGDDKPPFVIAIAKGTSHCGAGCTLGDLIAEWLAFAMPGIAVIFGWHSLFADKTFAVWILDFVLAFAIGVVFQYFTITPMRDLTIGRGIVAALKADIASIAAWQVGMYGAMAIIQFAWFKPMFGRIAPVDSVEFWFAMQLAMLAGFVTAFPVNGLLIRIGLKEAM